MTFVNCHQLLEIFSEVLVMLVKLQIAVFRASLIFLARFQEAVDSSKLQFSEHQSYQEILAVNKGKVLSPHHAFGQI